MNFIDVHCHINDSDYGNVADLLKKINAAGVKKIISVGFDLPSSKFSLSLSEEYPSVYFTAGLHPTELAGYKEGDIQRVEELLSHKKCVALGEIGLDYHYPDTDKILQRKVFCKQLELAISTKTPVQIHSRDSASDMLSILKEYAKDLHGFMLHCYSHSPELSLEFLSLGAYFSFGGTSTYSGSKKAKRSISALPIDRILTETDSPYLPPKSKYGVFPNTPESIPEIAENLAAVKGITVEEVADAVYNTAHALFKKLN